jgi:hypothetical protein
MDLILIFSLAFLFLLLPIVAIIVFFVLRGGKEKKDNRRGGESQKRTEIKPVVRLWRDPLKGKMIVEMDGANFNSAENLSSDQHHRLVDACVDLQKWLGASIEERTTVRSAPDQTDLTKQVESIPPASEKSEVSTQASSTWQPARSLTPPAETADERARSNINPLEVFTRALQPRSETQTPEINVVAQIDAILQEKLADSPLRQRGIRLIEQADRSMVVMIGMEKYASVDEVPDEAVKAVIRQSVSEWEDRMYGSTE